MDFSRNTQVQPAAPAHAAPVATGKRGRGDNGKFGRIATVAGAGVLAVLLIALSALFFGSKGSAEAGYVDNSKLQAVFLNTGQVYFGKVDSLNSNFFVLSNIYYLQTSSNGAANAQQAANTSVSLVKLGCELHEPFDKMVINRSQVTFWENLQDNGQVAKAVAKFQKDNPNGQKCADTAAGTTTNSSTVQNASPTSNTGAAAQSTNGTTGTTR